MTFTRPTTREAWLEAVTDALRPDFEALGAPLPATIRVSCGFTSKGARSNRIGECWHPDASEGKVPEVFIVPGLSNPLDVGATLVHELVHAYGVMGHGAAFRKLAVALGLEGKMTATTAGEACKARLAEILEQVGPYPHAKLVGGSGTSSLPKKQSTRMLKLTCAGCGCVLRMTRKWLDEVGAPTCACGGEMVEDAPEEEEGE